MVRHRRLLSLVVLLASIPVHRLPAQSTRPDSAAPHGPWLTVGAEADEWYRTRQLLGDAPADGYLLRSPSALLDRALPRGRPSWALLAPEILLVHNSALPATSNDAQLWAGRGWNAEVVAGVSARVGPLAFTLAPSVAYQENLDFQIIPSGQPARDSMASQWYSGNVSIDLPQRFGEDSRVGLAWGESSLSLDVGTAVVGVGTESQWWGPGTRNALLLGSNAPGIPHMFARTRAPIGTRFGRLEAKWLLGALAESSHFDSIEGNDLRSFTAAALTFAPAFEPNLTIGLARAVYGPADGLEELPSRALDPFFVYSARPGTVASPGDARDQISSAFLRWIFPGRGFEAYAEVARVELPGSLRDLLVQPFHSQGYTLGAEWVRAAGSGYLRLRPELTYLEQSSTFTQRPVPTFYVSRMVPHGYTHRGQPIGAGIGPGSSTQALALDYLAPAWQLGLFATRMRWNNDAYYDSEPNLGFAHDVSLVTGVRAGARLAGLEGELRLSLEQRHNYLFQNESAGFDGEKAVDIDNRTLRLTLRPAPRVRTR